MNAKAQARMREIFPGSDVPDWLRYSEKQRQMFAEAAMVLARANGAKEDETAFQEFGYSGSFEYWSDRFSEPMKASEFITLLTRHLRRFGEIGPGPVHMYEQAFDLAQDMKENWFFDGPKSKALMVHPVAASSWLFSLPKQKHLVPLTLVRFLQGNAPVGTNNDLALTEHEPKPRGRPKDKSNQVIAAMKAMICEGAMTHQQLKAKTEKELANTFGASRDTVRKARDLVLSENVENGISDISSTNDK